MGAHGIADVDDVRSRLLRGRNDAGVDAALRCRALRLCAARLAATVRRHDRGGHADQQDGAGAAQGLRPDARAALRDLDGVVRQWRRLLSLFLLGRAWLRPHRADRHLRARLPADGGSAALRRAAAAEEDPAHRHHRTLRGTMTDPADTIVPLLREMRAENLEQHEQTRALVMALDKRLGG